VAASAASPATSGAGPEAASRRATLAPDPVIRPRATYRRSRASYGRAAAQPSPDAASRYLASLPAAQFPNITALAGHYADVDPDQRFELLLDIFVGGLAQHAAAG
jgi:hypothetical protein